MSLNLPRIDIKIANFLRSAKDTVDHIEPDWYKRDEHGELIEGKNFQNHILKILIGQLIEQFGEAKEDRAELIIRILEFLNEFINERFIPGAYQATIRKVFEHTKELQQKPVTHVANIVFKELSNAAQSAFRDGTRVQTNGLDRAPTGKSLETMRADPMLVEILFMQLVWDAQKRNGTRQELLNIIDKHMAKMEQLFGSDASYTIVGTFSSLRSTLVEETQKESPLPALIKYIVSLVTENKKELEDGHKEIFGDQTSEEWAEITKEKAKPAVSIWQKKDLPPQESEQDKRNTKKKEEKKKKKLAKTEVLEKLKEDAVDSVESKGIETVKKTFDGVMGDLFGSLNKILPSGGNGGSSAKASSGGISGLLSVFGR